MPERIVKKIEKEYEKKGVKPKRARQIAYATVTKRGLWKRNKKPKKKVI